MNPRLTIVSYCNPIVVLLLAITISVSVASAYVLHPLHLLELMTSEIGQADSLKVSQKLVINESELPEQTIALQETVMYLFRPAHPRGGPGPLGYHHR